MKVAVLVCPTSSNMALLLIIVVSLRFQVTLLSLDQCPNKALPVLLANYGPMSDHVICCELVALAPIRRAVKPQDHTAILCSNC